MNSIASESNQSIQAYWNARSGQSKTAKLMESYISTPGRQEHIRLMLLFLNISSSPS